jgi:hypothetical protein
MSDKTPSYHQPQHNDGDDDTRWGICCPRVRMMMPPPGETSATSRRRRRRRRRRIKMCEAAAERRSSIRSLSHRPCFCLKTTTTAKYLYGDKTGDGMGALLLSRIASLHSSNSRPFLSKSDNVSAVRGSALVLHPERTDLWTSRRQKNRIAHVDIAGTIYRHVDVAPRPRTWQRGGRQ